MGNLYPRPEVGEEASPNNPNNQSKHVPNIIRVRLSKGGHVTYGLVLEERDVEPRILVADVVDGTSAATSGLVQRRDLLLKVNEVEVRQSELDFVFELLKGLDEHTPAVFLLQSPEGYKAFLQTIFLADGSSKTIRVTTPIERNRFVNLLSPSGKFGKMSANGEERGSGGSGGAAPPGEGCEKGPAQTLKSSPSSIEALSEFLRLKVGIGGVKSPSQETPDSLVNPGGKRLHPGGKMENGSVTSLTQSPQIVLTKAGSNSDAPQEGKGKNAPSTKSTTAAKNNNIDGPDKNLSPERRISATSGLDTPGSAGRSPSSSRRGSVCTPRRHQKLRFLTEDSIASDTLYNLSVEGSGCDGNVCKGSLLSTPPKRPPGEPRPIDEVRSQAKDFIDQYYTSIKRFNTAAHHERLEKVLGDIEKNGIYEQTTSELTFGAKTAWRNASRCIGRIQWSKLQVFDARHISTAHGMFESICNHIKYATNKGNIRSAITIFPPRTDGRHDFRLWNGQVISYAGYKQPDGSIIGDPANAKFTEICLKLGWKGPGGMFDVLPLLLQANGQDPEMFTIPPDLILEATITHPNYDWFAELGLKWYGLPAVANMGLDCGGLEYVACPFNGWYMGTEIGARDLCDKGRYNLAELVAKKMGLDVTRSSSLWKDRAIVEVNVAVLHSFQAQRITITDHHAASDSFMKHMENEGRLRGGTPADWVWIVPPISGSACPVFHQEMLNYKLKPSYEYLEEPWKTHVWEKDRENGEAAPARKKRSFKEIARAVNFSARLMGKALAKRIKCTILYATETGKSETYAKRLCQIFGHAFDAKVMSMDEYDIIHLEHEALVLYVVSTFGNGDPPEPGEEFAKDLYSMMKPAHSSGSYIRMESLGSPKMTSSTPSDNPADNLLLHTGPLSNVMFSVFGLGSQAYPKFCAFGKFVDRLMGDLGAERINDLGTGDELCGQEQSFQTWAKAVFKAACESFCLGDDVSLTEATSSLNSTDQSWAQDKFKLSPAEGSTAKDLSQALSKIHNKSVKPCKLISRTYLQSKESDRQTILVKLSTHIYDSELMYNPGDHVGIYASNRKDIVDAILSRLDYDKDPDVLCNLETLREKTTVLEVESDEEEEEETCTFKQWVEHERLPNPISVRTALTRYLDITTPPTPIFLKQLAALATDEAEKKKLQNLASTQRVYEEWKYRLTPTLAEVLQEFPSVRPCPTLLLCQLPLLQPRFYSISSSPRMFPGEIHVTVAVVTYRTQDGAGPVHYGVCSTWLNKLKEGDVVPCFVRGASSFHLPEDKSAPIIMVGPGTGIAPFRSFWQERRVVMDMDTKQSGRPTFGPMLLYFGCRYAHVDNVYGEETGQAVTDGVLTAVYTALSRQPGQPKTYVQHLLQQNGAEVVDLIVKQSGHFYVCGDVTMAAQVCATLESILATEGNMTPEQARDYIIRMKERTRFHEDIFGTLNMSEVRDVIKVQTSKLPDLSANRRRSFQTAQSNGS